MSLRRKSHHAFTIVELLVAAAITALIVVMLGAMFGSLTKTTTRANQRIDAFRDARAALQMMERDLSGVVRTRWQPDPFATPSPSPTPHALTRPVAYLALKNIYDAASANQEIYALISTKNSGPGDLCSVGYYCNWDGKSYSLRRFFRGSVETYSVISSGMPAPSPSPAPTPSYISDAALYTPNPSPSPTPTDDLLAQYVWNLKIIAYDASGTALPYNLVCDGTDQSGDIIPISPRGTAQPVAIEISFLAMSPEAARTVIAAQAPASVWMQMDDNDPIYRNLIKPHAYAFRTRIKL